LRTGSRQNNSLIAHPFSITTKYCLRVSFAQKNI